MVSVIIASYNSENTIRQCLSSLKRQKTNQPFEVIVVDSSPDNSNYIVKEEFPDVRLYRFPGRKFCGDARNFGISRAKGDIFAFIDADCAADENWLERILKSHQSGHLAVGGAIANGNPNSSIGWAAYFCEFNQWLPGSKEGQRADMPGANMSYKKNAFEKYGNFLEETYCSDTDFNWRMAGMGDYLFFEPSIVVFHNNINKTSVLLKHEYYHGRSFAQIRVKGQRFSRFKKILYASLPLAISLKLFIEIFLRNIRNRIYLKHFLKTSPLLIASLIAWSLGESRGYVHGKA